MPEGSVRNFDEISNRLDQIIATVRSKDTSLERSLDLFDEAIELGSRAVDMVDKFELTPREADSSSRNTMRMRQTNPRIARRVSGYEWLMAFMKRVRLDDELISQGICADRADALRTLMAGLVSSGGERLTSPGLKVTPGLPLHVKGRIPYVGAAGSSSRARSMRFVSIPRALPASMWDAPRAALPIACSSAAPPQSFRSMWVALSLIGRFAKTSA